MIIIINFKLSCTKKSLQRLSWPFCQAEVEKTEDEVAKNQVPCGRGFLWTPSEEFSIISPCNIAELSYIYILYIYDMCVYFDMLLVGTVTPRQLASSRILMAVGVGSPCMIRANRGAIVMAYHLSKTSLDVPRQWVPSFSQ